MSFQDLEARGRRPLSSRRDLINAKQDPTQVVASGIFQINTAVSTFHCLVNTLGTLKDTPELREKLHKTRLHIGQLVKDTSAKLKQASETHHGANIGASKKIVDAKLAKDFQAVLKEFQKAQRLAAERETAYSPFVPQVVLPSSYTASEIDISSDKTSEQRALLVEARRQEVLLLDNEISFNEAVIEEREQGIHEIQQQIGEVNEIFKDLVVLVHDQGAMIDDIGSNVENAHAATAQGRSHLAKASKNQRSNSSLPLTALFLASRYAYTTFVHLTGMVIKLVLVILLSRLSIAISSHESSSTTNQPFTALILASRYASPTFVHLTGMVIKLVLVILLSRLNIAISSHESSSTTNQYSKNSYDANSNEHGSNLLPCEERYLTEAYFREYDSLVDSNFQQFVLHKLPVGSGKAFPMLLGLDRHLIGEGSHRCLSSSIRFSLHPNLVPAFSSQLCEVIIIERLPSGVFADPFEIEHLLQHRVFKDASVFGDVNLELPSFRSNRSVVEVHLDAILNKSSPHDNIQEVKIEIPLHARYPPLEDSGYSKVRFGVPDLTIRCKMPENLHTQSCLVTPIASNGGLKHNDVVWSIPAGIEAHAGTVSVVTFASALLSAILIIIASFQHSHVDSDERLKRS